VSSSNPLSEWELEREIVISRVIAVPRAQVFQAWVDPAHFQKWFGPAGFSCELLEANVRVGGRIRFVFHGPNGARFDNRMVFRRIDTPNLIEFDHGSDMDDDPNTFRVTITFDEQSNGKTVLTLRQLHPSKERRDATIGFGAVEYGNQTLDKLERHLPSMSN
jgi:uncharacterized protein YndB with AHSA1/START domain